MIILSRDIERYVHVHHLRFADSIISKLFLIIAKPSLFAICVHRYGYWVQSNYLSKNKKIVRVLLNIPYHIGRKLCMIRGKFEILDTTPIGPGLVISDKGHVTIGAENIDENVTISCFVTLGMDMNGNKSIISDHVFIGDNSVVYGKIKIGKGSIIEPGSVLTKSIPDKISVKGNPARMTGKEVSVDDYIKNYDQL